MSDCTKIECKANLIRSGHYKKESNRRREALTQANQCIAELEENRTMLQRVVSVLRNVAFEYDNDWRENSPRWLRYLEALQPKEKRNEN